MPVVDHRSRSFVLLLLFLQFIFCFAVFFDIQPLRQIIGFLYLTFIPGYIALKLLKLCNLSVLQTFLFSSGLSIALLMLLGLVVNEFGVIVGFSSMLSSLPLMLVLNVFVVGELVIYLKRGSHGLFDFSAFKTLGKTPLMLLLSALPVLSVAGAIWENVFNSSLTLLFTILIIAVLMALSIIFKKLLPTESYPLIILSIALALLFHSSLISNYICGTDIQTEYYVFAGTHNNGSWNQIAFSTDIIYGRLNSMLSITVLPTFYSNILNMDGTWIFKIIFPLIFSLVPLGLYEMWHPNFDKKSALVAAFLFMSQSTFYAGMIQLARQMIGELFFVLLFLLIFSKKLRNSAGAKICFIIFSFGLVVSHYAIALIFLFFIFSAWIFFYLSKKGSLGVSLSLIGIYSLILVAWDSFVSASGVLESILSSGRKVFSSLGDLFSLTSRGDAVLQGVGLSPVHSNWALLSRLFAYSTEAFILVGSIVVIHRFWRAKSTQSPSRTYSSFSIAAIVILGMCILIPTFALTLNMERFYHITLFFLAPLFVLGCGVLTGFLVKRRVQLLVSLLVAILIVSYFLFQSGFVYEVTKDESWSIPLSGYRLDKTLLSHLGSVEEVNVFGAQWINRRVDFGGMQLFADLDSRNTELTSYGNIPYYSVMELTNTTIVPSGGMVYLSKLNVIYGKIAGQNWATGSAWNSSELKINFSEMNKIYANGGCEIYVNPSDR